MGTISVIGIFVIFYCLFVLKWNKKEFDARDAQAKTKKDEKKKKQEEKEKKEGADPNAKGKDKKKGGGVGSVVGSLFWICVACFLYWLTYQMSFGLDDKAMGWVRAVIICFGVWKLIKVFKH